MTYLKILLYALATFMATSTLVFADDDDDDDGGIEIPFEEAWLFFELNDTDNDLGLHGKIDGDEWKKMEIEDPRGRRMFKVRVQGRLKRQGLAELFFESAEPTFGELDPIDFFKRFPEGIYEIEGVTLDGEERENEVFLSHVIPAAPAGVRVNGVAAADGCDTPLSDVSPGGGIIISWDAVTRSHTDLGNDRNMLLVGLGFEVRYYQVVVEIDDTNFVTTAIIPPGVNEWTFPAEFFELAKDREYKFEILVRVNNGQTDSEDKPIPGNLSAVESCFEIIEPS